MVEDLSSFDARKRVVADAFCSVLRVLGVKSFPGDWSGGETPSSIPNLEGAPQEVFDFLGTPS